MFKPLDFLYIYLIRNIWLMIYGVYKGLYSGQRSPQTLKVG